LAVSEVTTASSVPLMASSGCRFLRMLNASSARMASVTETTVVRAAEDGEHGYHQRDDDHGYHQRDDDHGYHQRDDDHGVEIQIFEDRACDSREKRAHASSLLSSYDTDRSSGDIVPGAPITQ
jgi:hypothetical protein